MRPADHRHLMPTRDQGPREFVGARAGRTLRGREMLMEIKEAQGVLTRGSAKVRDGIQRTFRVSGLGRRAPGSGVQVRVQVQDLNFAPAPAPAPDNPYLRPEGRDLRPESVSLWPTGQRIN